MENIINNIVQILIMNGSILIIPGVNFFLIVRYSLLYNFLTGFCCAIGVTSAIMLHAILSILSVSIILKIYPSVFTIIRCIGGVYLFYLGTRFLIKFFQRKLCVTNLVPQNINNKEAFYSGFIVDIFNPFVSFFYLSLFTIIASNKTSIFELSNFEICCYLCVIFIITLGWFGTLAALFTCLPAKIFFQNKSKYTQLLSAIAMYYFCSQIIWGLK